MGGFKAAHAKYITHRRNIMNTLFLILIGMFIGWNFPQPTYAKIFQNWLLGKLRNIGKK